MNWLDKAVSWLAPQAGLRRIRARRASQIIALAYEGAATGRRLDRWLTAGTSANVEIGSSLVRLRDRSHALVRDNPYAARALHEFVGSAIGTGITAQTRTDNPELNQRMDQIWQRWVDECDADNQLDFYGLQDLITKTVFESGECLVRFRQRRSEDGFTVPLQLQVLEPDYLDLNKTGKTETGYTIQGVEFDLVGRRIFYWLFGGHPGDLIHTSNRGSYTSARVPAEDVLHIYRKDRPGQVRGVPWLAPVVLLLRELDEYEDAELMRKRVESCYAAFVTQPEGADGPAIAPVTTDSAGHRVEQFEPGMVGYLKPGESVTFGAPHNVGGYKEYVRTRQSTIASAECMMAPQITGDYSEINYTSFKAGFLSFRTAVEKFRWLTFIPMLCAPVWERVCLAAETEQLIPPAESYPVHWTPPGFGSVEPYRDAMAMLTKLRTGVQTLPQAIAEQGFDPVTQLEEIARTNALLDKLGLTLDCDPRKVTQTGAEQANGKPAMEEK